MNETAISKPIKPTKIAKGIKVNKPIKILLVNNLYKNPDNIANKQCPAVILANNRTPKDTALAQYDTNSIQTNAGTKAKGVPSGTKNEKNVNLCKDKAKIVTPINKVKLAPIQTIAEVVTVKL